MSLFGNKDIIPDDIAENIAQNLFVVYNRGLEFNIDEDISRYEAYVDIKLKPFWHYCSGDRHYTLKLENKIISKMESVYLIHRHKNTPGICVPGDLL